MKREAKEKIVQELDDVFETNNTCYLVDFKQMKVSQAVELRKLLRNNSFSLRVIKNRLALRAVENRCPEELKPYFQRATALAYTNENPIALAKILMDFSAKGKVLAVKAGVLEGQFMTPEVFGEICKLNSRDDLLGKIGYLMAYPLTQFLRTLRAPLGNLGVLLGQLRDKEKK